MIIYIKIARIFTYLKPSSHVFETALFDVTHLLMVIFHFQPMLRVIEYLKCKLLLKSVYCVLERVYCFLTCNFMFSCML